MGLTLFLIARLAVRLIHPQAGWFAVFACLTLRGINYEAADARPYALGMCIAAAALLFLVRWFDSLRWRDGLLFVLFAALLWRVHLLFWPLYLVFEGYAIVRRKLQLRTAALFALAGLSLVPVLFDALALLRDARAHAFAAPPGLRDFVSSLKLTLVVGCGAGAWLLARWRGWRRAEKAWPPGAATLILGWWFCAPVALFIASRVTGSSVFVPRYLAISLPGAALAATLAAARWIPPDRWKPLGARLGRGRAAVARPVASALAAAPQFRLAGRGARGQRNRGPGSRPGPLPQPFRRGRAAAVASGLSAPRLPL